MKTVILTPIDNVMTAKFTYADGDVLFLLDSTISAFSVSLPDVTSCGDRVYMFKNIGANNVTLNTVHGQIIDVAGNISTVLFPQQFYSILSNLKTKWVSLESNILYAETAKIGDYLSGNYTNFASNGHLTMFGNARPYRDEMGDAINLVQQGTGVALNVTESTVEFNTAANLSDYSIKNCQLNHDKDITALIYPHIHFFQASSAVPNFLLQYRWQKNGIAKVTGWANLKCNVAAVPYTSGTIVQISQALPITPPAGSNLSDIVQFRVLRDNANTSTVFSGADPYSGTVGILYFDLHFMTNSLGSDTEYTK